MLLAGTATGNARPKGTVAHMAERRILTPEQVAGFRRMRREQRAYGGSFQFWKRLPLDGWAGLLIPMLLVGVLAFADVRLLKGDEATTTPPTSDWMLLAALNVGGLCLIALAVRLRRAHRRIRRFNACLCIECGFDLTNGETATCPQCGATALR